MSALTELNNTINYLPRGGILVTTSAGYVQLGAPPETIKDTMALPDKVPQIFIIPGKMFSIEKGIAVAELEFPVYFNHFLMKRKTLIIGTAEQAERITKVLQESVFGPTEIEIAGEFPEGEQSEGFPNLKAEIDFFRGDRKLEDLIEFGIFDINGEYRRGDLIIHHHPKEGFSLFDKGKKIADLPLEINYNIKYDIGQRLENPYEPPEYGITCLGPSHGFDPVDNTSGFILWLNHRGIMIDPPVNSTEWLSRSNVNPKLISHVILTHCHADHDAGTFQKILEEGSITIHTTQTIMESFIRKYEALTGLPRRELYTLFSFSPVTIDQPVYFEGAEFNFYYSVHSIPAIGFKLIFRNQSFIYTSDHLNHPETFAMMREKGVFTDARYEMVMNFPWDYKVIYHEAGIPPLHTPVSFLASLPEEIQEKITVYHIARKDFPENSKLKLAKFGIENTLYPEIRVPLYPRAIQILDVLNHVDLFQDFPLSKAREFLSIVEEKHYAAGEKIIEKGTPGESLYIIVSGVVRVEGVGAETAKRYGIYEYFGEASLVTGELRSADVFAETEVEVLTIEKTAFHHFINGTNLEIFLRKLHEIRQSNSWNVLNRSPVFSAMTSHQKTQLEIIMEQETHSAGTLLVQQGQSGSDAYILVSGGLSVPGNQDKTYKSGDFVGDLFSIMKGGAAPFSVVAHTEVEVYRLFRDKFVPFVKKNPGVYMRLLR